MFPYSLLAMAVLMYLPALIWRQLVMPVLGSDLLFVIDELDNSYNRSVRMAQSILDMRQNTKNPLTFQAELDRSGFSAGRECVVNCVNCVHMLHNN